MKLKTLSPILAIMALALIPTSAKAQANQNVRVVCENLNGTPTTIIRGSKDQPIFHWHPNSIPSAQGQQLCQQAARNLQAYLQQGGQERSLGTYETGSELDICINQGKNCQAILFSLPLSQQRNKDILGQIIDPKFLTDDQFQNNRSVGRVNFPVPWWQLVF